MSSTSDFAHSGAGDLGPSGAGSSDAAPAGGSAAPAAGQSLFSVDAGEDASCGVCGEAVESGASALCSECGQPFHLVLRNDAEGKNCGEVWLNEEFLALEFGCARCLAVARGQDAPSAGAASQRASAPGAPSTSDAGPRKRVRHEGRSAREIVRRRRR